jgi:MerR HTH family regulatory protein
MTMIEGERTTQSGRMYSTQQVCKLAGVTYRQLDRWVGLGFITTANQPPRPGTGNPRLWTESELARVKAIVAQYNEAMDTVERFRSGELWATSA